MSVKMLLIEHVSAYLEAIIRFNNFQLYETNKFRGIELFDDEISTSNPSIPWNILVSYSWKLFNLMMASE